MTISELHSRCRQYEVRRTNMEATQKAMLVTNDGLLRIDGHLWTYPMTTWALNQLCRRLEVPYGFMRKCPNDLMATVLNRWVEIKADRDAHLCIMTYGTGPQAVGIVSPRYIPYKYPDFVMDVGNSMQDVSHDIDSIHLGDRCLDCDVLFPEMCMDIPIDGVQHRFMAGIHLRNSDVGYSAAIAAMIIRNTTSGWSLGFDRLVGYSFARTTHVGDHDEFPAEVGVLVRSIDTNWISILDRIAATTEFNITVENIRDLITSNGFAKDILDGRLGIEVFADDTDTDSRMALYNIIDGLATQASEVDCPMRWNLERICGDIIISFEDALRW